MQDAQDGPSRTDVDAIVVGAGFSGLDAVHVLRERGYTVQGIEAAGGVGGTWYWNRYPGARTDSKAFIYCLSFSKELREEWDWSELYPTQPEVLAYLEHVADRFDLKRYFAFDTTVTAATWDDDTSLWTVDTSTGRRFRARYLISGVGCLSAVNRPQFDGIERFQGRVEHTARWPQEGVDVSGQRVALIGAGSSGVQLLPELAKTAGSVTLFQRTPNYVAPYTSTRFSDEDREAYRRDHEAIQAHIRQNPGTMYFSPAGPSAKLADPAERETVFEQAYAQGGLAMLLGTYEDLLVDPESNDLASEFLRSKIKETVHDRETAEILTPRTYPFGVKRPPCGVGYLDAFNEPTVSVVDVRSTPIEGFTERGLVVDGSEYEFDVIILATGFDASVGALLRLNVTGRNGRRLADVWAHGPESYLGLGIPDFPNLFTIIGPLSAFGNLPTVVEHNVDFVADLLDKARAAGTPVVEADVAATDAWVQESRTIAAQTLLTSAKAANSWIMGANLEGRELAVLWYPAGANTYFDRCDEERERGFPGFSLAPAVPTTAMAV
ncbi:NAD(P)/FAD-dependent oxidoreductase [Pseudonocardia xishanensis]|uniref:NAD(P)/FAD-dependent oxidoreductase n=1 Tax=Pseudonocardia xishanensis TaxID=630995 RepID=A0ABP8S041_9PSEU